MHNGGLITRYIRVGGKELSKKIKQMTEAYTYRFTAELMENFFTVLFDKPQIY